MIKVFITDDELLVLMGLRVLTDWEARGIEIVGEAQDGRTALKLIIDTAPDIVITDLKMPIMDGIELIKSLKQTGFQGRIIILSNYNEFQMVKEAMKAGASDYVMKVTLNGDELVKLVHSLAGMPERKAGDGPQNVRTHLALEWLRGDIGEAELRSRIDKHRLRIGERNCLIGVVALPGEQGLPEEEVLRNILLQVINRKTAAEALALGAGRCLLIIPAGDSAPGTVEYEEMLREVSEDMGQLIRRYLNLELQLVYQPAAVALPSAGKEIRRLVAGLESFFYDRGPGVKKMDETRVTHELEEEFWQVKRNLLERLESEEDLSALLQNLFCHMEDKRYGNKAVRQISRNLLTLAEEAVRNAGGELYAALDSATADLLDKSSDFTDYRRRAILFFERVQAHLAQLHQERLRDDIRKAIHYIKKNYQRKLTLEELSSHVNLNKSYFSTLFKQETDASPVEFIIQFKMEKANELLRLGSMNVSDVSQHLGYDDLSYFNKLFKKHFGTSPGSVRRKRLGTGHGKSVDA